jgi:hypothetical protein
VTYAAAPDVVREFFISSSTATPTSTHTPTRTFTPTPTPTLIPLLMKKGAVGASFVLGLLQNGTLITWGMNREYQTNIPPCCGSGMSDIAVGTNFAIALKGGMVFGWGANTKGQLKFPAGTKKDIVSIAAGGAHGMALTRKGFVLSWGDNGFRQVTVPKGLRNVTQIAGGTNHSLVIKSDGSVQTWGSNAAGQTKAPPAITRKPAKKSFRSLAGSITHLHCSTMEPCWRGAATHLVNLQYLQRPSMSNRLVPATSFRWWYSTTARFLVGAATTTMCITSHPNIPTSIPSQQAIPTPSSDCATGAPSCLVIKPTTLPSHAHPPRQRPQHPKRMSASIQSTGDTKSF